MHGLIILRYKLRQYNVQFKQNFHQERDNQIQSEWPRALAKTKKENKLLEDNDTIHSYWDVISLIVHQLTRHKCQKIINKKAKGY
jgi:hypothetical protein